MTEPNGVPTLNEIARRLQRIEDRLDVRILSLDVYSADKVAGEVLRVTLEHRVNVLERTQGTAVKLLITAMFGILGQAVFIIVQILNHGARP